MVHWIRFSFVYPQLGREIEFERHFDPHHSLGECGLYLLDQCTHSYWCLDTGVNGINPGTQILELLFS